jgi:hypothetical protein
VTLEAGDRAALREMVLAELRGGDLAVLVRQLQGAVLAVPPLAWASVTPRGAQVFDLANGIAHAALGAAGSLDWTWLSIGK